MSGKLIMLFKDKEIDFHNFEHLADVVIFNQYAVAPGQDPAHVKVVDFEANEEEIQKLVWFTQFSGKEVIYVLDRPLDIRERLKGSAGMLGGNFKLFDIVLVQLGDCLYCIKNKDGHEKLILKFACQPIIHTEHLDPNTGQPMLEVEDIVVAATKRQAREMRESFIHQLGMVCEHCGFDQTVALNIYPKVDKPQRLMPIRMIVWGKLRDFADVQAQVQYCCRLLCHNCVDVYNSMIEDTG